jgi:hypothetical protein
MKNESDWLDFYLHNFPLFFRQGEAKNKENLYLETSNLQELSWQFESKIAVGNIDIQKYARNKRHKLYLLGRCLDCLGFSKCCSGYIKFPNCCDNFYRRFVQLLKCEET